MLEQVGLARQVGQALRLQVVAAGVGGAAQQEGALALVLQVGRDGVEAHEGRQGDGVGAVALEGFLGVLLGGGADVAALGVQDDGHMGRDGAHVGHELFQLLFGAVGREVGDLGLEGVHQIGRGLDDGGAEFVDFACIAAHGRRKAAGFGVQAHAQHGLVLGGGIAQHVEKGHGARF